MAYDDRRPATKGDLREHAFDDREQFATISKTLTDMKENHLAHIQEDQANMRATQERNATNIKWIMAILLGIMTGIGTIAITYMTHLHG